MEQQSRLGFPTQQHKVKMKNLEELIKTVAILRSENGCQWDREQSHQSLRPNMLEEAYEAVDAIDSNDMKHLKEELGDVLLQVVLHSQIANEANNFNIDDVAKEINEKLIRRHPHVFGEVKVNSTQDILDNWDKIKGEEKTHRTSIMDGISKSQSALMSAQKISKKAVKVGFEWDCEKTLYDCVYSELDEFKEACKISDRDHIEEEMGDIFFALVNLARWNKLDAEQALLKANKKFVRRFKMMEKLAIKPLEDYSFQEFDALWKQAKKAEKQLGSSAAKFI